MTLKTSAYPGSRQLHVCMTLECVAHPTLPRLWLALLAALARADRESSSLPNIYAGVAAPADPLAVLIADSGGAVGWALQGFSLLALATSFIGTCTGA